MPRKPRLSVPGALHHVMARGIEGRQIFHDDEDRRLFLSLLSDGISKTGFKCYAWVLMGNHYHLLLRVNEHHLASMLRPVNSKYARWFRKRDGSRGYLFQDRFKSIVTQDQGYIEELVRYIHLNPMRANICYTLDDLDHYPWSGHAALVGTMKFAFQDIKPILKRFGDNPETAKKEYRSFIKKGIDGTTGSEFMDSIRKCNHDVTDRHDHRSWVIGDPEFVKAALAHDRAKKVSVAAHCKDGWTVQKVASDVASQLKIDEKEIFKRGRGNGRSNFRKVVAALSHRDFGIPLIEIARYFGIGSSSVSRMLEAGEEYARKQKVLIKH